MTATAHPSLHFSPGAYGGLASNQVYEYFNNASALGTQLRGELSSAIAGLALDTLNISDGRVTYVSQVPEGTGGHEPTSPGTIALSSVTPNFNTNLPDSNIGHFEGVRPTALGMDEFYGTSPDMTSDFTGVVPVKPATFGSITANEPAVPGSISIDLTGYPNVNLITVPSMGELSPGNTTLYASTLLTAIQTKLLHDVNEGGTGLGADIEQDLWDREGERALQAHNNTMDRISAEWSKRGMPLPNGVLAQMYMEEEINYVNRRLDTSRDISIKQAELAFQNTQFVLTQAVGLEGALMNFDNAIRERIYQAAKATLELKAVETNLWISKYNLSLGIYQALVNGRVEEARIAIQKYITEVQAYKTTVDAQVATIETNIKAFIGEVEAYKGEAAAYESVVKGYSAKVEAYKTDVQAWAAKIDAQAKMYLADIEGYKADAEVLDTKAKAYNAEMEGYKAGILGEASRIDALVRSNLSAVELYKADASVFGILSDRLIKASATNVELATQTATAEIEKGKALIQQQIATNNISSENIRAIGAMYAQLAAGAMAAIHVQASISGGTSESYAVQHTDSVSFDGDKT